MKNALTAGSLEHTLSLLLFAVISTGTHILTLICNRLDKIAVQDECHFYEIDLPLCFSAFLIT
jgi:hypothetical protein